MGGDLMKKSLVFGILFFILIILTVVIVVFWPLIYSNMSIGNLALHSEFVSLQKINTTQLFQDDSNYQIIVSDFSWDDILSSQEDFAAYELKFDITNNNEFSVNLLQLKELEILGSNNLSKNYKVDKFFSEDFKFQYSISSSKTIEEKVVLILAENDEFNQILSKSSEFEVDVLVYGKNTEEFLNFS